MHTPLELILSHDGRDWFTHIDNTPIRANDLDQLQTNIANHIKHDPYFIDHDMMTITLLFDMACLPHWLAQYQSHYFNYSFNVNRREPVTL